VQGSILARSKFYGTFLLLLFELSNLTLFSFFTGNSLSAILDGNARLTLLNRGEDYIITMPYANCKGILIGKLTMELGGKVTIVCEKTRYSADIEFKLKVDLIVLFLYDCILIEFLAVYWRSRSYESYRGKDSIGKRCYLYIFRSLG